MTNKGWHITDDGSVKDCSATKQPCHYDKHYKNRKEALIAAKLNQVFQGTSKTVRNNSKKLSSELLSHVEFVKKLPPQIYAFIVPDLADNLHATKVGDTTRGVEVRLREWRQKGGIYENLKLQFNIDASFEDGEGNTIYVRDYNFHLWLKDKGYKALIDVLDEYPHLKGLNEGVSQEFYFNESNRQEEITKQMLLKSLEDQKDSYGDPRSKYAYYREVRGQQVSAHYSPVNDYEMRPFQARIVEKATTYFNATDESDAQFLLSAPTRSGKSFMAANTVSQLFATSPKKNNCVVVVSGFAEIEDEWKATFESHKKFAREDGKAEENKCGVSPCECGNKFKYLSVSDLRRDKNAVENAYKAGYDNVAVFLTLQDLSGSTKEDGEIKEVHEFLQKEGSVDFLIGDEAHFAMFSDGRYQDSIKTTPGEDDDASLDSEVSDAETAEIGKMLGTMAPTIGKLFVTATPYNNVPWGTKYNQSVNAAVIRENDIRKEKDEWDAQNAMKDVPDAEWANPSYGLPEKKMFGIDIGIPPNELFRMSGRKFVNQEKVREFITGFFGASPNDNGIPNFFGSKEFSEAGLGNHIYATLPSRKACDAFEAELRKVFVNRGLDDYEILNISSNNPKHKTTRKRAAEIKDDITKHAEAGKKTITITCNRMGTGVTQEYWDTVLLLRTMSSAQQFQQTAGRPGTPHVSSRNNLSEKVRNNKKLCRNCESNEIRGIGKYLCEPCFNAGGAELESARADKVLKHIEKPNVAVISLDPGQLVRIRQESIIADIAEDPNKVDSDDVDRITDEELEATPLYITTPGGLKLEKVTASNIMEHFLSHLKNQGVREMVSDLPINSSNISRELETALVDKYEPVEGESKVFETSIVEGDYKSKPAVRYCIRPGCEEPVKAGMTPGGNPFRLCEEHFYEAKQKREDEEGLEDGTEAAAESADKEYWEGMEKRIRNVYISTLLYAVLSKRPLTGIDSIVKSTEEYEGSRRLARHLGLDVEIMQALKYEGVSGLQLDNRVKLFNDLTRETTLNEAWERLTIALNSFKKFSDNEVPTPDEASKELVDTLRLNSESFQKIIKSKSGVIDIGTKSAINLVKIYEEGMKHGVDVSQKLWSIPTSGKTYELTRRVYKDYGWDLDKIIYHDNLTNIETAQMVYLMTEQQGCQAANPSECRYHNGSASLKKELDEIRVKMDDDKEFRKISRMMKDTGRFDFSISNPPYQRAPNKNTQRARRPIYPEFIELGSKLSDCSVMIHPIRAFRGVPETPSKATANIMNSEEFSVEHVEIDSKNFFPTVEIKGGVMITRFERGSKNKLKWSEIGVPTEALKILHTVSNFSKKEKMEAISTKMTSAYYYTDEVAKENGVSISTGLHSNHPARLPHLFLSEKPETGDYITVHAVIDQKRAVRYISKDKMNTSVNDKMIKGYKVFIPAGMKEGNFGETISDTIVAGKDSVATRTFTSYGPFSTKAEAEAASKYLKTRFARLLLSTKKLTQNTPIHMFSNIPQQDFTKNGRIDWTKSVKEIDAQLYKQYGLSEKQIRWVEKNIEEMN